MEGRRLNYVPFDMTAPFSISYLNEREMRKKPSLQHYHNAYELDFFVKAELDIFVRDNKYTIRDGDFFFINEYEIHRMFYNPNRPYSRYVINFSKDFVKGVLLESGLEPTLEWIVQDGPRKVATTSEDRNQIKGMFSVIADAYDRFNQTQDTLAMATIKINLLMLLIRFKELSEKQPPPHAYNPHIKGLIDYMDKNYMNPITMEQLAEAFDLSKFYISHLFKEATRFTVFEYLLNRRIMEAKKLLEYTDQSIVHIALNCGFNNLQHFYRIFKRQVKATPLQYRRAYSRSSDTD
jgi:AraC-like DNA-binding protein